MTSYVQDELELPELKVPERVEGQTIQERFESFHALNPWLADELERLARRMIRAGRKRISIETLVGKVRWDYDLVTVGDRFKINDHFTSRYVRLLIERNPEWSDVFTTRRIRTE